MSPYNPNVPGLQLAVKVLDDMLRLWGDGSDLDSKELVIHLKALREARDRVQGELGRWMEKEDDQGETLAIGSLLAKKTYLCERCGLWMPIEDVFLGGAGFYHRRSREPKEGHAARQPTYSICGPVYKAGEEPGLRLVDGELEEVE